MPAVNSAGNTRIDHSGRPFEASTAAMVEKPDLGRGVEAEPEQEAERIHVPALADHAEQPAEQPREEAAAVGQHGVHVLLRRSCRRA